MTRLGGWTIEEFDVVASTNETARQAARAEAPDHSVFVAARQSAGRGRGGNQWTSPEGGLYASILLREVDGSVGPLLPLVVGESVRRAVAHHAPGVDVLIKWPNDVLAGRRGDAGGAGKVAGVLVESASSGTKGLDWAVAGLGVNVASALDSVPATGWPEPVSMRRWLDDPPDRFDLLDTVLDELNRCLFACATNPERFVLGLNEHLALRGQVVVIRHAEAGAPGWEGTVEGLSADGSLRVSVRGGTQRVQPWQAGLVRPVSLDG